MMIDFLSSGPSVLKLNVVLFMWKKQETLNDYTLRSDRGSPPNPLGFNP